MSGILCLEYFVWNMYMTKKRFSLRQPLNLTSYHWFSFFFSWNMISISCLCIIIIYQAHVKAHVAFIQIRYPHIITPSTLPPMVRLAYNYGNNWKKPSESMNASAAWLQPWINLSSDNLIYLMAWHLRRKCQTLHTFHILSILCVLCCIKI